jgi:hypothetical protein
MNMTTSRLLSPDHLFPGTVAIAKQGVVAIVSDNPTTIEQLAPVCEFLDLKIEVVSAGTDLEQVLQEHRPMAVVSGHRRRNTGWFPYHEAGSRATAMTCRFCC